MEYFFLSTEDMGGVAKTGDVFWPEFEGLREQTVKNI